tara:strand:- start:92 stop:547 length:456 start_codon:yes stop_codon:yes gene_type:complete
VNKNEAEQYFEENLSLEVKIIDNNNKVESFDLVELNLKDNQKDREISVVKKEKTNKKIKALTEKEIKKIKKNIKKKRTKERIVKKKQNTKEEKLKVTKNKKIPKKSRDIVNKNNNTFDVCTILEKCSIDEISKYLIKLGKKKNFPDITLRE